MKTYVIIDKEVFYKRKYFSFCIVILFDSKGVIHSFKFHLRKMFKISNSYPCWSVEIHTILARKTNDTFISCGAYMVGIHPEPLSSHSILEYYSTV